MIRIATNKEGRVNQIIDTETKLDLGKFVSRVVIDIDASKGAAPEVVLILDKAVVEFELEADLTKVKLDIQDLIQYAYQQQVKDLKQKVKEAEDERRPESDGECSS